VTLHLEGGNVVITGGAGLLGRALANAFAARGARIVVVDVLGEPARVVADEVRELHQVPSIAIEADVADRGSMDEVARRAVGEFGPVSVLVNNAGRAILKLDVQLGGVLNGIQAFVPGMVASPSGSHVVNTASMSGVGRADLRVLNAPYVTAKFAVVGLSEAMAPALAEYGVGVSVLCPGYTHPDPGSVTHFPMPSTEWYRHNILSAAEVAEETVAGVLENRLHIFPHRCGRQEVVERHELLMRGFNQAEATSPPVRPR
jgi:NAD(P)-dependent dehydrogenase (short-subunit alcohol dehydrogenase family)